MPQLAFGQEGAGVPVVCLHSGGFTSRQWKRLAAVLAPTHRVILPDLLGYGATGPWTGGPFHYQRDVDAVLELLAGLGEPAHVVGHSYGGFLAAHVARATPVRSLALYEPVTFSVLDPARDADALAALDVKRTWEPDASGSDEAWFTSFVDWWNGPGAWAAMPEPGKAAFRAAGKKLFDEVVTLSADTTGAGFAAIAAPALILGGARSPLTERRTVARLAETIPGARLEFLADAGHMGPITHHAAVNAAIAAHVRAH
jgi:pimeloyl-ACP methyl ester carboxylesterase